MEKILLSLSITKNATPVGQLFLEFCVKNFGGKSKLFETPELNTPTAHSLAKKFLNEVNKKIYIKTSEKELSYGGLLNCDDLADSYKDGVLTLHFNFLSKKKITEEIDGKLGDYFLKKVRQLFDELNSGEQLYNRTHRAYEAGLLEQKRKIDAYFRGPGMSYSYLFDD